MDEVRVFTNNKGSQSIVYEKHTYRLFRKHKKSGDIVWRCNKKSCSVTVTTNSNVNAVLKHNNSKHDHGVADDVLQVFMDNKGSQSIVYKKRTYRLLRKHKKPRSVAVTTNSNVNAVLQRSKNIHDHVVDGVLQVFTNNKGSQSIVYEKHAYRFFRKHKNSGDIVWRCNKKSCSVTVTTDSKVNAVIKHNKSKHGHGVEEINTVLKEIRRAAKCKAQVEEKPLKIILKELCESPAVSAENIDAIRRSIYRERRKRVCPVTTSSSDAVNKIKESNIKLNQVCGQNNSLLVQGIRRRKLPQSIKA